MSCGSSQLPRLMVPFLQQAPDSQTPLPCLFQPYRINLPMDNRPRQCEDFLADWVAPGCADSMRLLMCS